MFKAPLIIAIVIFIIYVLCIIIIKVWKRGTRKSTEAFKSTKQISNWDTRDEWEADVLYRWANPESFQKKKNVNLQRYRDNKELLYSMRLIQNIKGIRNIHILAKGKAPKWLDITHPRIFYHDEEKLFVKIAIDYKLNPQIIEVYNSESCKYLIPYLKGLHPKRFIMMDDDYLIEPIKDNKEMSTSIFYNHEGIPFYPKQTQNCHRPIPFLTKDYINLVNQSSTKEIESILTQKKERTDPLDYWTPKLIKENKVIPIAFDSWWTSWTYRNKKKINRIMGKKTEFCLYFHNGNDGNNNFMIKRFLNLINKRKPIFVCVNDDWPTEKSEYNKVMSIFNKWRQDNINQPADWEMM